MNKPEQDVGADTDVSSTGDNQAKPCLALQKITETMENPGFDPEQLPELWKQLIGPYTPQNHQLYEQWWSGINAMFKRCETYPQYSNLAVILSEMPDSAWHYPDWAVNQAQDLFHQATPEQIRQALKYEQQHPGSWWSVDDDVLEWATVEQLTGHVIEQLTWHDWLHDYATDPEQHQAQTTNTGLSPMSPSRRRHIVEHVHHQLLGGDDNAWHAFLGLADDGTLIGDTAELVLTIEQSRPARNKN